MNGYGEYTQPDGRRYEGQFVDDFKQGEGTMYWPDGQVYKGNWLMNKQHGRGKLTMADEGRILYGEWHNGQLLWYLDESGVRIESEHS